MIGRQKYKVRINGSPCVEIIHNVEKDYNSDRTLFPRTNKRANIGDYEQVAQEILFHLDYEVVNLAHKTLLDLPEKLAWFEEYDKKPAEAYKVVHAVTEALDERFVDDFSHAGIPDILALRWRMEKLRRLDS